MESFFVAHVVGDPKIFLNFFKETQSNRTQVQRFQLLIWTQIFADKIGNEN